MTNYVNRAVSLTFLDRMPAKRMSAVRAGNYRTAPNQRRRCSSVRLAAAACVAISCSGSVESPDHQRYISGLL
jgi:hypothetical protein